MQSTSASSGRPSLKTSPSGSPRSSKTSGCKKLKVGAHPFVPLHLSCYHRLQLRTSWNFFLRPAGGRLGPLAESGSVLPVGECLEVHGQRTGRARQNFLRRRRQLAKLVRAVASQEMNDEMRNSAAWDECKTSIEALQKDVRGLSDVQAKTEHEIASFVTGLKEVTEGLAEVRAHMLGQFWASTIGASMQGMRGAGGLPLATTGAARHPTTSDVEVMSGDVEGLCGALTRLELLEEACDVWEDIVQTEAVKRGELAGEVNRLRMELEALQRDGVQG